MKLIQLIQLNQSNQINTYPESHRPSEITVSISLEVEHKKNNQCTTAGKWLHTLPSHPSLGEPQCSQTNTDTSKSLNHNL